MERSDAELIDRFVAVFERLDDLIAFPKKPPPDELPVGVDVDDWRLLRWRPRRIEVGREQLRPIYARTPAPFPPLYERLILTYRWLEVDLRTVRLLPNPPGATLGELYQEIFRDRVLVSVLVPAGFVPFARATDLNYDPVCFDLKSKREDGDCRIVQFEHESILCHDRIGERWNRYSSFRELMRATIELANQKAE